MDRHYKALTPAELYAFEKMARQERARVQAEILRGAGRWLKRAFVGLALRPYAPRGGKMRHA